MKISVGMKFTTPTGRLFTVTSKHRRTGLVRLSRDTGERVSRHYQMLLTDVVTGKLKVVS